MAKQYIEYTIKLQTVTRNNFQIELFTSILEALVSAYNQTHKQSKATIKIYMPSGGQSVGDGAQKSQHAKTH